MTKPTCVSLFSGGGGLCAGLVETGYDILFSSDIEKFAENTHNVNFPKVPFLKKDIQHITPEILNEYVKGHHVDLLVGGPPCQGFSNMGDKMASDSRNLLIFHYMRVINLLSPKFVLFENVPGVKTKYNGSFFLAIVYHL